MEDMKTTGSIASSSRFLVSKLTERIDFANAKTIVELGAGNGSITHALLNLMKNDACLYSFEINDNFLPGLRNIVDHKLILINDSAANLHNHVHDGSVDVVVSSLPLTNMSEQLKKEIIEAAKIGLKKGGQFLQYQYSLSEYSWIKSHFSKVDLDFTPLNIPPAFIYICHKD